MRNKFFGATFVLCTAFATTFSVSAQTRYQAGVTFGSNYSTLSSDLFTTGSGKLGVAAGCSFVFGFGDHFELNPEFVFTQKGADAKAVRYMPEEKIENSTYSYNYNTFEAGLFAGFQPVKQVPVRLQAGGFFGTYFNHLDQSQDDLWIGNYTDINQATLAYKLNGAFSGLDFGPAVGISGGSQRLRVNARYYFGAKNLYNNLDFVTPGHHIRTSSLRVTLTYFL